MEHNDLLAGAGPAPTHLPTDPATELLRAGTDPAEVAARYPSSSAAWAALAERAFGQGEVVAAYAYARTGYHRGLDQLRRAGWRGNGPVPWEHEPNQGFLRSLAMLAKYKVPKVVHFTDELPRNASGKLLKRVLREKIS